MYGRGFRLVRDRAAATRTVEDEASSFVRVYARKMIQAVEGAVSQQSDEEALQPSKEDMEKAEQLKEKVNHGHVCR